MSLSADDFSASNLYCGEDAGDVASWDADAWTPPHDFLADSDDRSIETLLDSELHHLPESDYLGRFRDRSIDVTSRQDAVNWILKVHAFYNFRPVTASLSVNYLDRFLSRHTLPQGKNGWPFQLLSVACLSLAAKMEETDVPVLLDFQVFEPRFVFEPRTVQRMELLVLANLKWRMRSVTPFDFIDFFMGKLRSFGSRYAFSNRLFSRVADLILSTNRVIDFLGHRPSAIAAAAVLCAAGESVDFPVGDDRKAAAFYGRVSKEMVSGCHQLMESYLIDTCPSAGLKPDSQPTPQSPVGVLDAAACASCDTQKSAQPNNVNNNKGSEAERVADGAEPLNKRRNLGVRRCTESIDTGNDGECL